MLTNSKEKTQASIFLLTGATGFLGKVVLESLLRRRTELNVTKIIVIIRPKRDVDVESRFLKEIASSQCFSLLPEGWTEHVHVVKGDLPQLNCGIDSEMYEKIIMEITHVIHCAGSIKFNSPWKQAASSNITAALNTCELAKKCRKLKRLVTTSTAYVTPHTTEPIYERLAALPISAEELVQSMKEELMTDKEALELTGHPNTYTLTKCVAEHLVVKRYGELPLAIVRPSIISASRCFPFTGWIDSHAAFAGFVVALSCGALKVLDGDPNVLLDIIPVDDVAERLVEEAMSTQEDERPSIVYAVATLKNCSTVAATERVIAEFFSWLDKRLASKIRYHAHGSLEYIFWDFLQQKIPILAAKTYFSILGNRKMAMQTHRMGLLVSAINHVYPYFVNNTFDFRPSKEPQASQTGEEYVRVVCSGVERHLLQGGSRDELKNMPCKRKE